MIAWGPRTTTSEQCPPTGCEKAVKRLAIIGQPLGPTAIETVQRAAIEATGSELRIERWERKPHQLAEAFAALKGGEFAGAIVASPHKEKAAALAGPLSDNARASGAVNVVAVAGARLRGHNTDVSGVRAGLTALLPRVAGKWPRQAVVLGSGGGARAVVTVLIGAGFLRVAVFNRHLHRAEALVAHFARSAKHMDLRALPWHDTIIEAELGKARLVVNASGEGSDASRSPVPAEALPADLYLLDLVMSGGSTPLVEAARRQGATVANGELSFLTGQAEAFSLLSGQQAPLDAMRDALPRDAAAAEVAPVVGD